MKEKRSKIWIDKLQTTLSLRIACYFIIYQVVVWSFVALERSLARGLSRIMGPEAASSTSILSMTTAVILGFLFIRDAIRITHRVVGPLYRFRQTIKAITAGEEVPLIRLRKGDYLQEMKDELNEMLSVLEQRGVVVLKRTAAEQGPVAASPTSPVVPADPLGAAAV